MASVEVRNTDDTRRVGDAEHRQTNGSCTELGVLGTRKGFAVSILRDDDLLALITQHSTLINSQLHSDGEGVM